jgi:hypothetical protein
MGLINYKGGNRASLQQVASFGLFIDPAHSSRFNSQFWFHEEPRDTVVELAWPG